MSLVVLTATETAVENHRAEAFQSAKNAVFRFLARREYSRRELYQRLVTKGYQSNVINEVLDYMAGNGYQSDERFAEIYVRSRIAAGDGPFKIKIALRAKGICDSLALAIFDKTDVEWIERAQQLKVKRFTDEQPTTLDEYGRQLRYLKNKGFYQDHIDAVLNKP